MAGIIKVNQYQDFNGNTIFTSDGSGKLTTQNFSTPEFMVYSTSNQSIANATHVKMQYDTVLFDSDNCWDSTNYRFTVPSGKAGKYILSTQGRIGSLTTAKYVVCFIKINGTTRGSFWNSNPHSGAVMMTGTVLTINLSEGDYAESYMYHDYGSARNNEPEGGVYNSTCFQGFRIGS